MRYAEARTGLRKTILGGNRGQRQPCKGFSKSLTGNLAGSCSFSCSLPISSGGEHPACNLLGLSSVHSVSTSPLSVGVAHVILRRDVFMFSEMICSGENGFKDGALVWDWIGLEFVPNFRPNTLRSRLCAVSFFSSILLKRRNERRPEHCPFPGLGESLHPGIMPAGPSAGPHPRTRL